MSMKVIIKDVGGRDFLDFAAFIAASLGGGLISNAIRDFLQMHYQTATIMAVLSVVVFAVAFMLKKSYKVMKRVAKEKSLEQKE